MTQSIFINVGQCGNQISYCFWDLALKEHSKYDKLYGGDEAFQTFFQNSHIKPGYKARSVMIDMESGVVNEIKRSPLRNIFDRDYLITDSSGSGNNWATGNIFYGKKHEEDIRNLIRKAAEPCDYLQSYFFCHSLGGGTGSGLCTFILRMLADEYPEVNRLVTSVFPSHNEDVITSPYNTALALKELTSYADCVFPIENDALSRISTVLRNANQVASHGKPANSLKTRSNTFDEMNNIVANMLLDMTCSSRFSGSLNVDLLEISMNLVPFPRMQYLLTSQSPINNSKSHGNPRSFDQMFTEAFQARNQLTCTEPAKSCYLASAVLVRGKYSILELRRNVDKFHEQLNFIPWNKDGWKIGHCYAPPLELDTSLLSISNNTSICTTFKRISERFMLLLNRKAHLHHYLATDGFDMSLMDESSSNLRAMIEEYEQMENYSVNSDVGCNIANQPAIKIAD